MSGPAWLPEFLMALDLGVGEAPRIGTLATVDDAGRPRARSVVLRRIGPDGSLAFATDTRSAKVEQARHTPFGEAVFWIPSIREQYRLAGALRAVPRDDPEAHAVWIEMSPDARTLFFAPPPGTTVEQAPAPPPDRVPPETPIPESFALLVLTPDRVESLDLKPSPHRRRRWEAADGWSERAIHP